jgi:cleavage and polyadenylation specificity factor subunit 1
LQDSDDELQTLLVSDTALRLEKQQIPGTTISMYCDTSAGKPRPNVPAPLRLQVFQSIQELSHAGTKATAKLVAQRFVWPGKQKDFRTWAWACQACQGPKVSRHIVTPVGGFTLLAARFLHIHIDLVGPFPTSAYCLTAVDSFIHWPEAISMAHALLIGWISRFGCAETITTDQGRQLESQLFYSLAKLCAIQLSRTTTHHSYANGLLEFFHQMLKAAIMCHTNQQRKEALSLVLLRIRTSFKADLQVSEDELV